MKRSRKILIIKTGFSEFLDRGISTTVSLGDVLICTSILHLYKNDHVTWLTSHNARHLLKNNTYIDQLIIFGPVALKKISKRPFDVLINLEKDIGLCTYLTQIKAKKRYGFYFNNKRHDISTYKCSTEFLLSGQENHRDIRKSTPEILYETVNKKWNGEGFIIGYEPKSKETYDIGFNYSVGTKWPTKAWANRKWKKLEKILGKKYKISWQKGHKDILKYVDWINSCRLIVTSDSLGQVVAQSLGKHVITLFGPTNYERMKRIPRIKVIPSTLRCPYRPCFLPFCKYRTFCMDYISPEKVAEECMKILR